MTRKILLSAQELHELQTSGECVIVDCRFDLKNTEAGRELYLASHIPGAVYAHLDNDLSGPVTSSSGRHPLPGAIEFEMFLARSAWHPGKILIAYDDIGGAIAARLWWLMKYFGHDSAALLDGGIPAWKAAGFEVASGQVQSKKSQTADHEFRSPEPRIDLVVSTTEVIERLERKEIVLADARAYERFAGEIEPIDPVAGHIPGSKNFPFNQNLNTDGTFKPVADIRRDWQSLCEGHEPEQLVHMCGSGVTACQNLFSADLAGLKGSKLYVGSWSEWIKDPSRSVGKLAGDV